MTRDYRLWTLDWFSVTHHSLLRPLKNPLAGRAVVWYLFALGGRETLDSNQTTT